jgi:uncharacterized protein YodC (DUF2158 family)
MVVGPSDHARFSTFSVGDIVVLTSGGPQMVVNGEVPGLKYSCAWIGPSRGNWQPYEHVYSARCLKLYEVPPVTRGRSRIAWAPGEVRDVPDIGDDGDEP